MRLRISLTLSFERTSRGDGSDDAPQVNEKGSAILERAEPAPIGFVMPEQYSDPFEDRR